MIAIALLLLAPVATDDKKPDDPPKVQAKAADGDAPLADGFPDATKPGTIEAKRYPAYRSAVSKVDRATLSSGDMMFFALFGHIQKNKIEMTAPVINTYLTPNMIETPGTKGEVEMEFVYQNRDLGKPGKDGRMVEVVDHPAREFACLGIQGGMTDEGMKAGVAKVRAWIAEHKGEWVEDGPARRIGYHGPMTPVDERLWEVQIPIKPVK